MTSSAETEAVLEKLRTSLKRRGAEGIRGLSRHFKIVDRDRSGSLDIDEFANACRINNLGLNASEQRVLFQAFDQDGNGTVNYEEFLRAVRGRLSPVRKKAVRQIFDALDNLGGHLGYLTIETLKPIYSVSNHPAVKAGKMTKDEALQELLNGFEGSQGNRDGKVSLEEWIRYYEEVSVSIDSDDYFGTMLSGTWAHLKRKNADGSKTPVLKFTAKADVDRLEQLLIKSIYAKVQSDTNLRKKVEAQFASFDIDKSGEVSIDEFVKALEKFGMHVAGKRPGVGGLSMDVVQSLFDKYDADGSGSVSYKEFAAGLLSNDDPVAKPHQPPPLPSGGRRAKGAGFAQTDYLTKSSGIFNP